MGKIHILKRIEGEISVKVLEKATVINGKVYPRGYIHVLSGVNNEEYAFKPEIGLTNYNGKDNQEFYLELLAANDGKIL